MKSQLCDGVCSHDLERKLKSVFPNLLDLGNSLDFFQLEENFFKKVYKQAGRSVGCQFGVGERVHQAEIKDPGVLI